MGICEVHQYSNAVFLSFTENLLRVQKSNTWASSDNKLIIHGKLA